MKRQRLLTGILIWRDLLPAPTGHGWRQLFTYRIASSLLPTVGIFLFLFLAAAGALGITTQSSMVEKDLTDLRSSPYNALFTDGNFFSEQDPVQRGNESYQLSHWAAFSPENLNDEQQIPGEKTVFSSVHAIAWPQLEITLANGQELPDQKGFALQFQGPQADASLLKEITNSLTTPPSPSLEEAPMGIILSRKALDSYGFQEVPQKLRVQTRNNDHSVELTLKVATSLPYDFDYVISMRQWRFLKTGYYDATVGDFTLRVPLQQEDHLENQLPLDDEVEYLPSYEAGDMVVRDGLLETPKTRASILEAFAHDPLLLSALDLGPPDPDRHVLFNGAVMHLNYDLLDKPQIKPHARQLISSLRDAMEKKQIEIHGGLFGAVLDGLNSQYRFQTLLVVFAIIFIALLCLLFLFFAVVLHTRMHRIGVMRMLGVPDIALVKVCLCEACLLWILAFTLVWFTFVWFQPMGMAPSPTTFPWLMFGACLLIIELSLLAPMLVFLKVLTPHEMISYRS